MSSVQPYKGVELLRKSVVLLPKTRHTDGFDVQTVTDKTSRIIRLGKTQQKFSFDDKEYSIPQNIDVKLGDQVTRTHETSIATGSELAHELDTEASLSASYAGETAEASAQYSYSSSLKSSSMYAIASVDHRSLHFDLHTHSELLKNVDDDFLKAAAGLPEWDHSNPSHVYGNYIEFFQSWGTHLILACDFGARYQLRVSQTETEAKSKENFQAHFTAKYNGVASVKVEAKVKKSSEYAQYVATRKVESVAYGGKPGPSIILGQTP